MSRVYNPSFFTLDNEVEKYHPAMLSVDDYATSDGSIGHNVTLVGTESYYQIGGGIVNWVYTLIIHDNYDDTPENVWIDYNELDPVYIYKINEI